MSLPKFLRPLRKPSSSRLLIRQIRGVSMLPAFQPGNLLLGVQVRASRLGAGDVVVIWHEGREKLKRLQAIRDDQIWVLGDNPAASTDSRDFGWLPVSVVRAKVFWPNC